MNQGPYTVDLFVHFDDGDPAGITFFGNFFRMAERALELGLEQRNVPWKEWFAHPEYGIPLRHAEAEYHKMLPPGQRCQIRQGVEKFGDSSLVLRTEVHDKDNHLCATIRTTHVVVDKQTRKKKTIPENLRHFLNHCQF